MEKLFSTYTRIENPSMEMVFFTFVLSFLLSGLIAFSYEKTTQSTVKNYGAMQAFILGSTVATMILQAIGDNIASGLAMLGALTVVQFRTKLGSPRESVFMFASLGVGIACGLFGFFVAVVGTLFFCVTAFLIRFSPFHFSHLESWDLRFQGDEALRQSEPFKALMRQHCSLWTLESVSEGKLKKDDSALVPPRIYEFRLHFRNESAQRDFLQHLGQLPLHILDFNKKNKV